jgi:RNA-directed DNA polymerase
VIICKSRKSAERTLANIIPFIEGGLLLKVNRAKTTVTHISKIKYLGYACYRYKGKCQFRVHPKAVRKMKERIREITPKNKRWSNDHRRQKLTEYDRGWVNYYKLADMKGLMTETDEWLRRRIRAIYWKQWKRGKTRYRNLRALKLEEWQVHQMANGWKGYWRTAQMLSVALTNKIIAKRGYISMLGYYLKVV